MSIITLDLETTGKDWKKDKINLLGYRLDEKGDILYDAERARGILSVPGNILRGHNIRFDALFLATAGFNIACSLEDTRVLAYLTWPKEASHSLKDLVRSKLHKEPVELSDIWFRPLKRDLPYLDEEEYFKIEDKLVRKDLLIEYHREDILNVDRLSPQMPRTDWFKDVEMPLTKLLFQMEFRGINLDRTVLEGLRAEMEPRVHALHQIIDIENPNSNDQIRAKFIDKGYDLKLLCEKTDSGEYSVDADFLKALSNEGEVLATNLLEYKRLSKLLGTYITPFLESSSLDGRLHGGINQAGTENDTGKGTKGTKTGRLASANPNLQNIPQRTEIGRKVRTAFVADPGMHLYDADLKQIQPRFIGHFSQSRKLIHAYNNNLDTHSIFARDIFGHEPSKDERFIGKTSWLASIFGCSPFTLLTTATRNSDGPLSITVGDHIRRRFDNLPDIHRPGGRCFRQCKRCLGEAYGDNFRDIYCRQEYFRDVQENFKRTNPELFAWRDAHLTRTRRLGYVVTYGGRIIKIDGLDSKNRRIKNAAEREAVNYLIQGSEADYVKKATLEVNKLLIRKGGNLLAIIHDEWLFQSKEVITKEEFLDAVIKAGNLRNIPIDIDFKEVLNWGLK